MRSNPACDETFYIPVMEPCYREHGSMERLYCDNKNDVRLEARPCESRHSDGDERRHWSGIGNDYIEWRTPIVCKHDKWGGWIHVASDGWGRFVRQCLSTPNCSSTQEGKMVPDHGPREDDR